MIRQSKGKIFLADERGINQSESFSSLNTFNFGKYFNGNKKPFGDIYLVNDDSLDSGHSLQMRVEDRSYIILLPVMGAIICRNSTENEHLIAAGQAYVFLASANQQFEISNPFDEGIINFLQVWIKAERTEFSSIGCLFSYNVNKCMDSLVQVFPVHPGGLSLPFILSIGKFNGRSETRYLCKKENQGLFAVVIEGVFEMEGRLLHARDSLAIWDTSLVEIEALSNDAIILLLEIPFNESLKT